MISSELLFCAEYLDDVEKVRIATENRLRSMKEAEIDTEFYEKQTEAFQKLEHEAVLALQRVMKSHPLGKWINETKGIGLKQGARLIAAIGDITYNHLEDRPRRGPAELWAYCGYHCLPVQSAPDNHITHDSKPLEDHTAADTHRTDVPKTVAAKRKKGVKSNWNATAKMRAFLVAESCMKNKESPYRKVYDKARASWDGKNTTDGHKHNHALRLTAKEILKDLFVESKKLETI